jgi:lysyl-tRNA synthetase class 2
MRPEKKQVEATDEEFMQLGIPKEWIPVIRQKGFNTIEELNR